jgi:hypothetical protein
LITLGEPNHKSASANPVRAYSRIQHDGFKRHRAMSAPRAGCAALGCARGDQLDPAGRNRYGWPGKAVTRDDPWDVGWWRYRVPGRGQVDWGGVVDALYEGGFDGVLSVEHEDPVWGGDEEKVEIGLRIAYGTLRPLLVA